MATPKTVKTQENSAQVTTADLKKIPVVAIGASAGGLQPLEEFFMAAPTGSGWCFVVTQHLSPDFRSMMDKLLGRKTSLTIRHIEDGLTLAPDTIFLCKPNVEAVLEDGVFRTRVYEKADDLPHLPIDTFFASLTRHEIKNTVAVILSGSGRDGTRGAIELFNSGGHVLAQSPYEADFPSMPKAVIEAGAVDQILKASELPGAISEILAHSQEGRGTPVKLAPDTKATILGYLEERFNLDFGPYKPENVARRIARRQHLRGCATIDEYYQELQNDPELGDELLSDLLIGVTSFYRDPQAIAMLRSLVIAPLVQDSKPGSPLRIWVPGCASGEEAYTIAIELAEAIRQSKLNCQFRIIATDVHRHSLETASAGTYSEESVRKIPTELRNRYFQRSGEHWLVNSELRQRIIFSNHNVLTDPPFLDIDLVSCRNLMIYLRDDAQARVLSMFLFGLRPSGFLFLGPSESLGPAVEDFVTVDARWRLFQKVSASSRSMRPYPLVGNVRKRMNRPFHDVIEREKGRLHKPLLQDVAEARNRETLIRSYDLLLKQFAPSSILITTDGDVLSWFGAAAAFVDTMNNLADWTIEGVVHHDLHFVINVGIEKLRSGEFKTIVRKVEVDLGKDRLTPCTVTLEAIDTARNPRLLLVKLRLDENDDEEILEAVEPADASQKDDAALLGRRIRELERDLKLTEETLQHVTERLEASGEELQASNEELQASNEELQASNEELQASNEELHAVNEELVTLGTEHERKLEMFTELQRDTEYLLETLNIGIVVVASDLKILRFSNLIARDFELEDHDLGRGLRVIGPRLDLVDLPSITENVIETGRARALTGTHGSHSYEISISPVPVSEYVPQDPRAILVFHDVRKEASG